MKIRTTEQLLDALDTEMAWRRRELSALRSEIRSRSGLTQAMLLRAGTALLYAHWEGFIRASSEMYLNYVSYRGLTHEELSSPFVALCLRRVIAEAQTSGSVAPAITLVEFIRNEMSSRARVPRTDVIRTESNLSSTIFERTLLSIGLEGGPYALRSNLIDEELLKRRNSIAHGRFLEIGVADFEQVHDAVIEIVDDVKTQIMNNAIEMRFMVA